MLTAIEQSVDRGEASLKHGLEGTPQSYYSIVLGNKVILIQIHLNYRFEPQFFFDQDRVFLCFFVSLSRIRSEPETLQQGSSFHSFPGFSTASDIHAGISHQNLGDV